MIVKSKKTKEVFDVQCQQYEVGLYVVFYKDGRLFEQFGLDVPQDVFLNDLRNGKLGFEVIEE